jgi:glycosyltransferase involved in cell wall biosynthesis
MLIAEYPPIFSGQGIFLQRLVKGIQNAGAEVVVLTADFSRLPGHEVMNGIEIRRFHFHPCMPRSEARFAAGVIGFLARNLTGFDILHIHGFVDVYGLIGIFNRVARKKTITQLVLLGSDDPMTIADNYRYGRVRLKLLSMHDRVLVISKAIAASYHKAGLPSGKLVYIPGGVDTELFRPAAPGEKGALRVKFGIGDFRKVVTFVGGVLKRKGVDILIRAWGKISKLHPDAVLLIAGPDSFGDDDVSRDQLMAFINNIKAEVRDGNLNVRFVGRTDKVEEYLKCSDVFVLPSRKEGFGYVIIEAMACGVPPVVNYMDGVSSETVKHGIDGLIINDESELACAIDKLLADAGYAKRMGADARKKAVEYFDLNRIAEEYYDLYVSLLMNGECR